MIFSKIIWSISRIGNNETAQAKDTKKAEKMVPLYATIWPAPESLEELLHPTFFVYLPLGFKHERPSFLYDSRYLRTVRSEIPVCRHISCLIHVSFALSSSSVSNDASICIQKCCTNR